MLDVGFAELHTALFLNGKNHGLKLDSYRFPDLRMKYDKAEKELIVEWKGFVANIPSTNVAYYHAAKIDRKVNQPSHPQIADVSSAQVETPFGHVFEGPGKGKTGSKK